MMTSQPSVKIDDHLVRLSDYSTGLHWRLIRNLATQKGRMAWRLFTTFVFVVIAVFENNPLLLIAIALIAVSASGVVEYGVHEIEEEVRTTHLDRMRDALAFLLATTSVVLRRNEITENLQLAIMILKRGNMWYPEIRHNLRKGKHLKAFRSGEAWISVAEKGQTQAILLSECKGLLSEEDQDVFEDVSAILVAPIYKPNSDRNLRNLIGILTVYTEAEVRSTLLPASVLVQERTRCISDVEQSALQIARLLSYDHICGC